MTSCIDCSRMPTACSKLQESSRKTLLSRLFDAGIGSVKPYESDSTQREGGKGIDRVWRIKKKPHQAGRCWTSGRTRTAAAAAQWGVGREWKGRRWRASSSGPTLASPHCTGSGGPRGLGGEEEVDDEEGEVTGEGRKKIIKKKRKKITKKGSRWDRRREGR